MMSKDGLLDWIYFREKLRGKQVCQAGLGDLEGFDSQYSINNGKRF